LPVKTPILPFDREYLESGKSEHYVSITAYHQLDESFLKCKSRVVAPQGSPISKTMLHFWAFLQHHLW